MDISVVWVLLLVSCSVKSADSTAFHHGHKIIARDDGYNSSCENRDHHNALTVTLHSILKALQWDEVVIIVHGEHQLSSRLMASLPAFCTRSWFQLPNCQPSSIDAALRKLHRTGVLNVVVHAHNLCLKTFIQKVAVFDDANGYQGHFAFLTKWIFLTNGEASSFLPLFKSLLHVHIVSYNDNTYHSELYVLNRDTNFTWLSSIHDINQGSLFPSLKWGLNRLHLKVSTNFWSLFTHQVHVGSATQFRGLCVELTEALATVMNFSYHFQLPADMKWGSQDADGQWNGIIGELRQHKVDLAVAALTNDRIRENVVDFVPIPFILEYFSALYMKPQDDQLHIFFKPFKFRLWVAVLASVAFGALCVWCMDRLSVVYYDHHPISLLSSLWLTLGTLFTQGCEKEPRKNSVRVVLVAWWLYCVILMTVYSGNLVAFVTVTIDKPLFTSLEDIAYQTEYKIGCLGGTVYEVWLKSSTSDPFKTLAHRIFTYNESDPSVLSQNHDEHMKKVLTEKYVYLGDQTTLEEAAREDCRLVVGTWSNSFIMPYSVALQNNSAYSELVQRTIIRLQQSGMIQKWRKMYAGSQTSFCGQDNTDPMTTVDVGRLKGVILIGLGSLCAAFVILFSEIAVNKLRKNSCFEFNR